MPERTPPGFLQHIAGLYAITPDEPDTNQLAVMVEAALEGGVRWVQYRNKGASTDLLENQAHRLKAICESFSAQLIINDHVGLACRVGAAGVHIGTDDGDVPSARAALDRSQILGVSCYRSIDLAAAAERAGADYVAFGSLFASPTKPMAPRAPLRLFADARQHGIRIPLVGIGGIGMENIQEVIEAGADAVAVVAAVFENRAAAVIRDRAATLAKLFSAG